MPNSGLIQSWQAELKKAGIPATSASQAALALCRVLDHQLYIRDRALGDLLARFEKLKAQVHEPKQQGESA